MATVVEIIDLVKSGKPVAIPESCAHDFLAECDYHNVNVRCWIVVKDGACTLYPDDPRSGKDRRKG